MCSHLLAHDFVNNQFTFSLKSIITETQNKQLISKLLVVQAGNDIVELELGNPLGSIKSGNNNTTSILPIKIGDSLYLEREANVVKISSKQRGFEIECNLKFDLCLFQLRYFYLNLTWQILSNFFFSNFTTQWMVRMLQ